MARLVFTAQCGRKLAANARFPAWPLYRRQLTPAVDGRLTGGRRRRRRLRERRRRRLPDGAAAHEYWQSQTPARRSPHKPGSDRFLATGFTTVRNQGGGSS